MKCFLVEISGGTTGEYLEIMWEQGKALLSPSEYFRISSIMRVRIIKELSLSVDQLLSFEKQSSGNVKLDDLNQQVAVVTAEKEILSKKVKELEAQVQKLQNTEPAPVVEEPTPVVAEEPTSVKKKAVTKKKKRRA